MNLQIDCKNAIDANNLELLNGFKNSSILMTGGSGFFGSWIAEAIIYLNDEHRFNIKLFCLSRNPNELASHILSRKYIEVIEDNVLDVFELPQEIDYLIHAAGDPDNRVHSNDPLSIIDTIVQGTGNILSVSMRLNNLKKILHVSSGLVSGVVDVNQHNISENQMNGFDCNSLSNIYAEAKRCSESVVASYRTLYKMPITTIRPFTFIGPYQKLNKPWVINNFIRDAFNGGPIRILGNENTRRSYMYGADAAAWILNILLRGKCGTVYNIGGDIGYSLKEIAQKVAAVFPNSIKIQTELEQNNFPSANHFIPDVTLAKKSLNLKASFPLDIAIQKTINWYSLGLQK